MKRLAQKYWPMMLGVFALAVVGSGGWLLWSESAASTGQAQESLPPTETLTPLDPVEASQVASLRADLGLDDDALVGLNLSAARAEQVLSLSRKAALEQQASIYARKVEIAAKEAALRDARRRIRIGPRDEALIASLPTLQQEIAAAKAKYDTLLAGIRTQVEAQLSEAQRSRWAILRANVGERMPDRLLDLTDAQKRDLASAKRHYRRRLAQAEDGQARQAAKTTYASERTTVLDATHQQVLAAYYADAADASARVVAAVQEVLPEQDESAQ